MSKEPFNVSEYVKAKVEKHPELTVIDDYDTLADSAGHVFVISRHTNSLDSVALNTSSMELIQNDEKAVRDLIDTRFKQIEEHFGVK